MALQVVTRFNQFSFTRATTAHELASNLARLAQIIAFDKASAQAEPGLYAEIVAHFASDAQRIGDNH